MIFNWSDDTRRSPLFTGRLQGLSSYRFMKTRTQQSKHVCVGVTIHVDFTPRASSCPMLFLSSHTTYVAIQKGNSNKNVRTWAKANPCSKDKLKVTTKYEK